MLQSNYLLQQAVSEYETGNLDAAYRHAREALEQLRLSASMDALNAATLLQTICAYLQKNEECIAWEQPIQQMIYQLFPQNAAELIIMHFSDYTSQLFHMHLKNQYREAVSSLLSLLKPVCPDTQIFAFYENYHSARIAFLEEDYHAALNAASIANENWVSDTLNELGKSNLLLMCSCNAKINYPDSSIAFLEEALKDNSFSAREQISAQSILAELYLRANRTDDAQSLFEDLYRNPVYLQSVSVNARTEFCYNYALSLIQNGNYEDAASVLLQVLPTGYPLLSAVYACLHREDSVQKISALFHGCSAYVEAKIAQIKATYQENLAYSHLSLLQYQIDFALYSFLSCLTKKENPSCELSFSTYDVYSFFLNTKYVSLGFSTRHEENISPKAVMDVLPPDTLLLEFTKTYTFDRSYYHVFLVSEQRITCMTLGTCDALDSCIADFLALITSNQYTFEELGQLPDYRRQKDLLRRLLYMPLQEFIADYSKLIIAPAGNLIDFPFTLLPVSSRQYLGDTVDIRYCNTGKELVWNSAHESEAAIKSPFILGDPVYRQYPPLEHTREECNDISELFQVPCFVGADATTEQFSDNDWSSYDLLHIAAHGIFAPDARHFQPAKGQFQSDIWHSQSDERPSNYDGNHPESHFHAQVTTELTWRQLEESMGHTGILLSNDALLDCHTIAGLPLANICLATLSCCHSGQSTYQNTEGAYGMRRAFLTAGCQMLLVSLWAVDDTAASLFMHSFYHSLTDSHSIESAFRAAIEYLKNYEEDRCKPYEAPFYWAGYELIV